MPDKVFFFYLFFLIHETNCLVEPGKQTYNTLDGNKEIYHTLFKHSSIKVSLNYSAEDEKITGTYSISRIKCFPNDPNFNQLKDLLISNKTSTVPFTCNQNKEIKLNSSYVYEDGIYRIVVKLDSAFVDSVNFEFEGYHGYLSPIDWPLLPFYVIMCVLYSCYALLWLVLCCWYWKDILRIQYWIGAVIFLGMIEKAVFVGEYDSFRKSGISSLATMISADVISCFKRTLSRMLIIVVCLGFGIVKPRLGAALHQITLVGIFYFVFSCIESVSRNIKPIHEKTYKDAFLVLPLAAIDGFICLWIFISLMRTIRLLIMRKNLIKLQLYRHFRNTLIFAVIVATIYMSWSNYDHRPDTCISDWHELWWDTAFWHFLFSIILLIIMFLWRPSANNNRYAFSPLYDIDEDNDLTQYNNEAFGVKKKQKSRDKIDNNEDEDCLKWVDDNIPTSVLDIGLPGLMDSDEEINQNKVEMSKML